MNQRLAPARACPLSTMKLRCTIYLCATAAVVMAPLACSGDGGSRADQSGGAGSGTSSGGGSSGGGTTSGGTTSTGGHLSTGGLAESGGMTSSGGMSGATGDFFPEDLEVSTPSDGCWELSLTAFTLTEGETGLELYAAIRNDADIPTCAVQLAVELFDESGVSLAAATNTMKHPSHYLYSVDAETDTVVACVGPGEMTMGRVVDFPPTLQLETVAHLRYRCPSLLLYVDERFDDVGLTEVQPVITEQGTAYIGAIESELEVPLEGAYVAVFPTTASGRPVGMTTSEASEEVPAGGSWAFQTPVVRDAAAGHAAFFDFANPL